MPENLTIWVHGHAGMPQSTTGFLLERLGYCLRVKADQVGEVWVHYSVPTSRLEADQLRLTAVHLQMRTWAQGRVKQIEFFDGCRPLASIERDIEATAPMEPGPSGDVFDTVVVPVTESGPLTVGLGISLLVAAKKPRDTVAVSAVGVTLSQTAKPRP